MTNRPPWQYAALFAVLAAGCRNDRVVPQHVVPGGRPEQGVRAIVRGGCGSCHVIPGVRGALGKTGPPLSDFGDRVFIAGALVNQPDNLVRWIRNPQEIEPGTAMPSLGVSEADARDIAAYLYTLGDGPGLGPPHIFPIRWLRAIKGGH